MATQFFLNLLIVFLVCAVIYLVWLVLQEQGLFSHMNSHTNKHKFNRPSLSNNPHQQTFHQTHKHTKKVDGTQIMSFSKIQVYTNYGMLEFPLVFKGTNDFLIGTSEKCDLVLKPEYSQFISNIHCFITRSESGLILEDYNSTNGIYVYEENEYRQVDQVELINGKEVFLGDLRIRFASSNPFSSINHQISQNLNQEHTKIMQQCTSKSLNHESIAS